MTSAPSQLQLVSPLPCYPHLCNVPRITLNCKSETLIPNSELFNYYLFTYNKIQTLYKTLSVLAPTLLPSLPIGHWNQDSMHFFFSCLNKLTGFWASNLCFRVTSLLTILHCGLPHKIPHEQRILLITKYLKIIAWTKVMTVCPPQRTLEAL